MSSDYCLSMTNDIIRMSSCTSIHQEVKRNIATIAITTPAVIAIII
jgi:hypothetical protein